MANLLSENSCKTKKEPSFDDSSEATTRFELVIRVLQTHALPLGYVATLYYIQNKNKNDSKGI